MRRAVMDRRTTETRINVTLDLDGRGRYSIATGIRFLDHMLELFARHGGFNLALHAEGDLDVDQHHTVEDVGIALGEACSRALGTRKGINRAGYFVMPMDETLGVAASIWEAVPTPSWISGCALRASVTSSPSCSPISSAASPRGPARTST